MANESPFKHLTAKQSTKGLQKREVAFDKKCGEILQRKLGLWNYKPHERAQPGIPDRYIVGGNWIEFKHMTFFMTKPKEILGAKSRKAFSVPQVRKLDALLQAGDRPFVCVLVSSPVRERVWIEQWDRFKLDPVMTAEKFNLHLHDNALAALSSVFDRKLERNSLWTR